MAELVKPRLEGTVQLHDGRRIGFAEFGDPKGGGVFWLHGTPGARRQVPPEARAMALECGVRIIGLDRPGIGSSTRHDYPDVRSFAFDLEQVADALGIDEMSVIGLSGGGPYALAAGAVLKERVAGLGILGGVAPTVGPDAMHGGLVTVAERFSWLLEHGKGPLEFALVNLIRGLTPLASPGIGWFAKVMPAGDRMLLERPDFQEMFLDDILSGSRRQIHAPIADAIAFIHDWGFTVSEVENPVVWWHGDADTIVPLALGEHMVSLLPNAELRVLPGQSHLAGLGIGGEVLTTMLEVWERHRPHSVAG